WFRYHSCRRFLGWCGSGYNSDGLRCNRSRWWGCGFRHWLWDGNRCGRKRDVFGLRLTSIIALNSLFLQEAEDIIEDKVSIRLFGKEERLHELTPWVTVVRHFSDNLDNDAAVCGGLGVDGMDEDFAVLEADGGDLVVDFLRPHYTLAHVIESVDSITVPVDRSMACHLHPPCHG